MGELAIDWAPDILPGFENARIDPITLVRPVDQPASPRSVVLYVHGFNDYFFQDHLARAFVDAGHAFYAVDLARAGRSLKPGDIPHYMADASEQGDDISLAVESIATAHPGLPIVVHGHSTGGLTAAIWASERPHPSLAGLVLNSPLFGTKIAPAQRLLLLALPLVAAIRPMAVVTSLPSVYAEHQHVANGGRWQFDTSLKRLTDMPVRAAWTAATRRARSQIARGLNLQVPVLVARCDSSGPDVPDNPLLDRQDTVVSVDETARLAPHLGDDVEHLVIPGGVHDLSLSQDEPRELYFRSIMRWLDGVIS